MTNATASPSRKNIFLLIFGLPALALLLWLGWWQYERLQWKEQLIGEIEAQLSAEPIPISGNVGMLDAGRDIDYRPVSVNGIFDHQHEAYFLATQAGASGWHVYTPLKLADDAATVFINRGFVPYDKRDPKTRLEGQIEGEITITGLARSALSEKPSFVVPENDPAGQTYYWKDLASMSAQAGLSGDLVLPLFVDAGTAPNAGGLPRGGVTIVTMPNNHLQYMLTWWGLAAALAVIMLIYLFGASKRKS